ncbi:ovarian cancer G-protein coupled receptor 1-like [Alosa alosa]|uniref:ovarian cancer G-protein coupled receptor 1-like n=1 Tax=Alosa alosa TaxID=278164 RepID=UPI00201520FA|nr:ovarian cancer G-protein coupled receptor 1-like [Alosa alosa]
MRTLALVLIIYTVFFLPYIALMLLLQVLPGLMRRSIVQRFAVMTSTLLSLNPMVDPVIYVFMRNRNWVVLVVALPITLLAIYRLYFFIRADHVAPVYVINLLISDIVQIWGNPLSLYVFMRRDAKDILWAFPCFRQFQKCRKPLETQPTNLITITIHDFWDYMRLIFFIGVMANVCFMVFISAERYGMIAHPVWYRSLHTIRTSVIVSVTVWVILPIIVIITGLYTLHVVLSELLVMLLPYPWMIFFFVGTWRALSRNTSVPRHEQRRIMRTLALVLSIYTVLFLPYVMVEIDIYYPFRHEDERVTETVTEAQV